MNRDRWTHLALAAILIFGALLRLWNLDASEFKYDEARVSNLAAHFVDTGIPPVRGMGSSAGIDNPPLTIYLLSLPVLLSRDPLYITAAVALWNVLAIWGCYWLGKRYWNTATGLLAATLLAASPWATFYARKIWAQDLIMPIVILLIACLLAWSIDKRRWALSGAIISLTALTQIHLAALALVPLVAIVLGAGIVARLRQRSTGWIVPLLVGLAASIALYAPYVAFDAWTGWQNVRALRDMLAQPSHFYPEAIRYALLNVGGREIHALAGAQRFEEFLRGILNLDYWPDRIEEGLVVASLVYLAFRTWRKRRDPRARTASGILLLWWAAPVLFFLRSSSPVYPHYLIPLYPAPYLALAIAAVDLVQAVRSKPRWRWPVYGIMGVGMVFLLVWQAYLSLSIHTFVERHHTPGGIGTPIGILRRVSATTERLAREWHSESVVVLCPGDNPAMDECPAVLSFMVGRTQKIRFADSSASLIFPESDRDTLIVLAPGSGTAGDSLARYAQKIVGETIWLREGVDAYRFYRLPAGQTPAPSIRPEGSPVRLENGVSLLGYEIDAPPTPGQTLHLALFWHVDALPAAPPQQGYSFANHLYGDDGIRYGQRDGPGYPVQLWQEGDTIRSTFDIPVPANAPDVTYTLHVG
ncbi:MAG: glycosyltransferase family 39 protein, partial [Anaerolineae bacterium]